jgi:selenocysteine-specific elongation factor
MKTKKAKAGKAVRSSRTQKAGTKRAKRAARPARTRHSAPSAVQADVPPRDKLAALLEAKGAEGLREGELKRSLRLTTEEAAERAGALEAEGEAIILVFSPLFLVSRRSLEFLQAKIQKYLEQYHAHHPEQIGVSRARLKKRFDVPDKVLTLALKRLIRAGTVEESNGSFALAAFEPLLTEAEEKLLAELEAISVRGELDSGAIRAVQDRDRVSPKRMEKLLTLLVERQRVVQGKNDFYVHSGWLDELVAKLRARESKELSVADFKALTGLSRKFAIPLLELLDEMGVTKRAGSSREILKLDLSPDKKGRA